VITNVFIVVPSFAFLISPVLYHGKGWKQAAEYGGKGVERGVEKQKEPPPAEAPE
jgi:hypothetical protein